MFRFKLRRRPRSGGNATAREATDPTSAVLAEADALSDQGRAAEAIARLTQANRRRRDLRLDRRLADLRFEAFRQLVPPEAPPPWPEAVEDLWAGVRIPEISASELTVETLRSGLGNHGALIVRGLLRDEHVAQMTADIDHALAAYDAHQRGEQQAGLSGWYEPYRHDTLSQRKDKRARGSILTVESPPALFDLLQVFGDVGIDHLVRDYFGESPGILARKATLRRVAPAKMAGWHQDGAFLGSGIRSLNVWIALTDCGVDAPGLEVVGRRVETLVPPGTGAHAAWGITAADAAAFGGDDIERPRFEAGDAMLFDHFLVHRTWFDAGMTRDRHALETWLFAPSTYGSMSEQNEVGWLPRDQIPILY
ncbi:MAG: phytanoyl-CoA dioxygenase family protein [Acidimicrobiia bacterium]